jgi:hypothetical protein
MLLLAAQHVRQLVFTRYTLAAQHVRQLVFTHRLCYVMVPLQHTRHRCSRVGVGGGGFHGIRSVGVGAQPLVSHTSAYLLRN